MKNHRCYYKWPKVSDCWGKVYKICKCGKRKGQPDTIDDAIVMLKLFNACIINNKIPSKNSPCQFRLLAIMDFMEQFKDEKSKIPLKAR